MALPGNLTSFTLRFGEPNGYTDATGALALVGETGYLFAVDPSTNRPVNVKDVASGHTIVPKRVTVTIGEDGKAAVGPIPHTGQAGMSPTGWAWRVEWNIPSGNRHPSPKNLTFIVTSGATADYDSLVPAETIPAVEISQPTVASVNGSTGAVVLDAADVGAATPADLAAGLATKVNSSTYTAGLAAKQDVATLAAATASHVSDGSALDVALRAALVPRPSGGTNGQALVKSGTDVVWGDVAAGGDSSPPATANTVALLGTSITDANAPYDQGGGSLVNTGAGYFHWANTLLRQSMKLVLEAGVSGDTTGGMLARVPDVIASGAKLCVVEPGPNDVQGDSTFTNITTALASTFQQLNAAGILAAGCQIYPTTTIMATTARRTVMHRVNRWISEYARLNPGVIHVPWAGAVTDPSTGGPLAGAMHDGTHPSTYGGALLGRVLADALEPYIMAAADLPYTNGDLTNGLSNGLLLGNSAGVATGWTMNPSGSPVYTASKVARADGDPGEWQQIALSSGTVGIYADAAAGPAWTVGQPAVAMFEVDGDATNLTSLQVIIQSYNGTTYQQSAAALTDYYASTKRIPISRGVIQSHPITPPTGATILRAYIEFAGSGVMRVGRAAVRSVAL